MIDIAKHLRFLWTLRIEKSTLSYENAWKTRYEKPGKGGGGLLVGNALLHEAAVLVELHVLVVGAQWVSLVHFACLALNHGTRNQVLSRSN